MNRVALLLLFVCMMPAGAVPVSAQRHDAGLDLTEQSFAYGGNLDAVYVFSSSMKTAPSKSLSTLRVQVKGGKFRMSFQSQGIPLDTIITKDGTLSEQGGVTYNFNKPNPQSLRGMPPLPINFASFSFLKVKPESYYMLDAGSTYGLAQADQSGQGTADTFFDRSYSPVNVTLTAKDGMPMITEIQLGDKAHPIHTYRYSAYRKLGSVWLPGRIECQYFMTLPPATNVYTLKSLSTTVADKAFNYDQMLQKGDTVQDDNGHSVVSFNYDPTKSLEEMHAVAAASEKRINDELGREQKQRRYNSSAMLIILGVGLIVFWYARRRMNRMREQTPRPGNRVGI